jgi:PKD domain-containing protein/Big-like domain-containing protein
VTVHYECSDALSGLAASCPADQTLASDTPAGGTSVSASVADVAGNSAASTPVVVKIDKTAPTISATGTTADGKPYVSGAWTNQTVTVHYSCADALSGLAPGACPADQSISSDTPAAGTSVSGSVSDVAGNGASSAPILVRVDKTAPTISASATTADGRAYASGTWTNQTVTVHYSCADALSGLAATCPSDQMIAADTPTSGTSLSGSVSDLAGNGAASQPILVRVDKTAPTLACAAPDTAWHAGDVTLACSASDGGSGLASSSDASFTLSTNVAAGTQTASAQTGSHPVCDLAGNCATAGPLGPAKVDKQAPTTTATATLHATVTAYTFGSWTNTSVDVKLAAGDGAGSGVAQTYYSVDSGPTQTYGGQFTISGDANHTISYWSADAVGNTETAHSSHVQVDATPPTITATATTADGKPYSSGSWTNQTVTIHYGCADALSGVVVCPADDVVSANTPAAGQSFSHTISDLAGNSATSQAVVVKLDTTPPSSSTSFPVAGTTYSAASWNAGCNAAGGFCGSATDTLSGVAKVEISIQRAGGGLYWNGSAFANSGETFFTATGTTSWSYPFAAGNFPADGSYAIHVRATDAAGNLQSSSAYTITFSGVPAVTIKTPAAGQAIAFGTLANMTASFTDASNDSPWTCRVTWGDGQIATGGISGKSQPYTCAASHSYAARGSYTITVTVTNKDGATGTAQVTISVV